MSPLIVGGILLLLLLLGRRVEAGEIPTEGNGGGGGGGVSAPFPAVLPPSRSPMQAPEDEVFATPAACSIYSPPGECLPWNARPANGTRQIGQVTGPLLGGPAFGPVTAPGSIIGGAIVYAAGPVPGTTDPIVNVGGASRHGVYSARDPRVF